MKYRVVTHDDDFFIDQDDYDFFQRCSVLNQKFVTFSTGKTLNFNQVRKVEPVTQTDTLDFVLDEGPQFSSKEEERAYWAQKAIQHFNPDEYSPQARKYHYDHHIRPEVEFLLGDAGLKDWDERVYGVPSADDEGIDNA
jgi:hypothetical protein